MDTGNSIGGLEHKRTPSVMVEILLAFLHQSREEMFVVVELEWQQIYDPALKLIASSGSNLYFLSLDIVTLEVFFRFLSCVRLLCVGCQSLYL